MNGWPASGTGSAAIGSTGSWRRSCAFTGSSSNATPERTVPMRLRRPMRRPAPAGQRHPHPGGGARPLVLALARPFPAGPALRAARAAPLPRLHRHRRPDPGPRHRRQRRDVRRDRPADVPALSLPARSGPGAPGLSQSTDRGRTVFTNSTIPYTRYLDLKRGTSSFSSTPAFTERYAGRGQRRRGPGAAGRRGERLVLRLLRCPPGARPILRCLRRCDPPGRGGGGARLPILEDRNSAGSSNVVGQTAQGPQHRSHDHRRRARGLRRRGRGRAARRFRPDHHARRATTGERWDTATTSRTTTGIG